MKQGALRAALGAALVTVGFLPTLAVSVESWSASTGAELARGSLDGTAIDEHGRVRLAPRLETLWGPGSGVVWAVQALRDRGTLVALSGPARLLYVKPGAEPEVWFEATDESLVTALVAGRKREAWFGLSPEGRVLHARRDGSGAVCVEPLLETEARFVWALARDAGGVLWIGTGAPGRLLRLAPDGDPRPVFEAGDDPVRSIALLPGGGAVIGTGGRGRVIRIDGDDRAFVLLDADEAEIVAIALDDEGSVFALAANRAKQPSAPPTRQDPAARDASNSVSVVARPPEERPDEPEEEGEKKAPAARPRPTPPPSFQVTPGGALYRIDPDGGVRKIWETTREMPFAMVPADGGRVLVATGDGGRLYALDREGRASRLLRIPSDQASAMTLAADDRVVIGGTTDARVELLGPGPRTEGTYASPAVDAGSVADWGRLRWQAELPPGSRLAVEARSGNTADPDDTWSPWSGVGEDAAAEVATRVPPARWFQARFRLESGAGRSPVLRRIEISYQPRNRTPSVSTLTVERPGVVWVRGPTQASLLQGPLVAEDPIARKVSAGLRRGRPGGGAIRRAYEPGARTFTWQAEDADGDRLRYALEIARDGSDDWFALARDLEDDFYSWDARGMPDGLYRVRLQVDDALDNPNGTHRRAERSSDAFVVDNTRPAVTEPEVSKTAGAWEVRFEARDEGGSVAAVQVALDGGEWTPLSPLDGVADSARERYVYRMPRRDGAGPGRALMVRAIDAAGNLGGAMWRVGP